MSNRIKIFEYASFPSSSIIDQNRFNVALRLNPKKFSVCGFGKQKYKFPNHITTIHSYRFFDSVLKIASFSPDIIHTRFWSACLWMAKVICLLNPKCKHILTLTGIPEPGFNSIWLKPLIEDANLVTSISEDTRKFGIDGYGKDSLVIQNGTDTTSFVPLKHYNERLRILYVGRFVPLKNPEVVIKLAKYFPQCDFTMYGDGNLKDTLINLASKLNNVQINPWIRHEALPSIYAHSDIFLFPSEREGFANVILEAMASGLPVICFNRSSMPEIVENATSGFLANNINEMRTHLELLINDDATRRKLAVNARLASLRFDWSVVVPKWTKLFEETIN